jgi:acetyl esterase/lipase
MIAGGSAGGGLAAGTALMASDRRFPILTHQVLMSPMLDDRLITASSQELDGDAICGTATTTSSGGPHSWATGVAARSIHVHRARTRNRPVWPAEDLMGLWLSRDVPRRDHRLHPRLSQAGVSVDLHIWGRGFHGFDLVPGDAAITKAVRHARNLCHKRHGESSRRLRRR